MNQEDKSHSFQKIDRIQKFQKGTESNLWLPMMMLTRVGIARIQNLMPPRRYQADRANKMYAYDLLFRGDKAHTKVPSAEFQVGIQQEMSSLHEDNIDLLDISYNSYFQCHRTSIEVFRLDTVCIVQLQNYL